MLRRRANGQAGFVITLELVLIFTILGIGLLVGLVAIRNALFVWWQKKQAQQVWVYDSSVPPYVLGPVRDFDEHEAPRLFYIDRDVAWEDSVGGAIQANYRAFLGVRDDRFTTRHRIFYTQPGCMGVACISAASDETADNKGVGTVLGSFLDGTATTISIALPLAQAGGQGYLYALQQGPTYGIGADTNQTFGGGRLPGTLYRQTFEDCLDQANDPAGQVLSVWTSQTVVPGEACINLPASLDVGGSNCPQGDPESGPYGDFCDPQNNTSSNCQAAYLCTGGTTDGFPCQDDTQCTATFYCGSPNEPACCLTASCVGGSCANNSGNDLRCHCPGWGTTDPMDDWVPNGSNCCPPGSTPGQGGGGIGVVCNATTQNFFFEAEEVDFFNSINFTPPFRVNLPPDTDSFFMVQPGGSEGAPGIPTATPYDPTVKPVYNVAPGGEQSPP